MQGECERLPANFFVDTGSYVSIISKSYVDSLTRQSSAFKIRDITVTLTSFTSDRIKTYGEIDVLITVTNTSVKHTMIVADMVDYHCLLGLDFLKDASINIDVTRNELTSTYGTTKFMKHIHQLPKANTLKCERFLIYSLLTQFYKLNDRVILLTIQCNRPEDVVGRRNC